MAGRENHDPSAMNPDAARCTAKNRRTKSRCKNPAVRGKRVCRLHGGLSLSGEARTEKQRGNRPPAAGKINRGSFQKGNQAARTHGAYTAHLSPEEREEVERLRVAFTEELRKKGPVTAFDAQLINMAAFASVKTHEAAVQNAHGRIVAHWDRLFLRCLRELRATRATRDTGGGMGRTSAEVLSAMLDHVRRREREAREMTSDGTAPADEESGGAALDSGRSDDEAS